MRSFTNAPNCFGIVPREEREKKLSIFEVSAIDTTLLHACTSQSHATQAEFDEVRKLNNEIARHFARTDGRVSAEMQALQSPCDGLQ